MGGEGDDKGRDDWMMDVFQPGPGVGDGQGSLACCGPWGRRESDTTEQLKSHINVTIFEKHFCRSD